MSGVAGVHAVVPVKDLRGTKSRLAPILDPGARAGLTMYMMGRVVRAILESGIEDVCVVSPSRRVAGSIPPSKRDAGGRWNSVPRRCSCSQRTFRSSTRRMCGRY